MTRRILGALALAASVAALAFLGTPSTAQDTVCHFDGGGTLTAGNVAQTTDGRDWLCTEDGALIRVPKR